MKELEGLSEEDLLKIEESSLCKEEKDLLTILKLIKINEPELFSKIKSTINIHDETYIVSLLEKREGYDTTKNLFAGIVCERLITTILKFTEQRDLLLYNFILNELK